MRPQGSLSGRQSTCADAAGSAKGRGKGILTSGKPMLQRMLVVLISIAAVVALGPGCAGSGARISSPASGAAATVLAPASELSGIRRGSFGRVAASLYRDEGNGILQIKEDGTFTASATPSKARTNNLSKAWTWSGTVVRSANGLTLQSSQGPLLT
jgi:hypothetical protein